MELGLKGSPLVEAGRTATLTTTVTDLGRTAATSVSAALTGPSGWQVKAASPTGSPALATGQALTTRWQVTAPAGTATGTYDLTLTAQYRSPTGTRVTSTVPFRAHVVVAPPVGSSYLSALPRLSATNGWGPVEQDTSNGESKAGDGNPLTIGGTVFTKGLGVHADSAVEYYTGGACSAVTAQVGVDDETGTKGTVVFEVWADGTKVASTGVLTNAMPAQPLSADVSGAQMVRLLVTDGGDGIDFDHADWADLRISC
ncbi:NPCBM/NEW2 domain-containing protein [Streptomyces sp. NBC_01618]|uniref:NPCBM/NEW2 domain-containing protein n=1 Tax=Streptomyces sp. NBC_01618 TaxID=2975900 RepID=UPI00386A3DC2